MKRKTIIAIIIIVIIAVIAVVALTMLNKQSPAENNAANVESSSVEGSEDSDINSDQDSNETVFLEDEGEIEIVIPEDQEGEGF